MTWTDVGYALFVILVLIAKLRHLGSDRRASIAVQVISIVATGGFGLIPIPRISHWVDSLTNQWAQRQQCNVDIEAAT